MAKVILVNPKGDTEYEYFDDIEFVVFYGRGSVMEGCGDDGVFVNLKRVLKKRNVE